MAITVTLDTIEGSELNQSAMLAQGSKTRGGWASGLDGDPSTALDQILQAPGMPRLGEAINVNGRTMIFQNLIARACGGDQAKLQLVYEAVAFGQASAYVITTRSYEGSSTRSTLPGTREPLRIPDWIAPPAPRTNVLTKDVIVPGDLAHMTFPRTMREVNVSGVKYGTPEPYAFERWHNFVNDSPWRGLPRGYWRITEGSTNLSRWSGFYGFSCSATTQGDEDWSYLEILRNTTSGRYPKTIQKDYDAVLKPEYKYGIFSKPGVIRVCPFRVTDFVAIFGFGSGVTTRIPQQ